MLKDILTYPKSNLVSLINTCPQTYDKNPSLTKDSFNLPLVLFAILSKLFTLKLVSSMQFYMAESKIAKQNKIIESN